MPSQSKITRPSAARRAVASTCIIQAEIASRLTHKESPRVRGSAQQHVSGRASLHVTRAIFARDESIFARDESLTHVAHVSCAAHTQMQEPQQLAVRMRGVPAAPPERLELSQER